MKFTRAFGELINSFLNFISQKINGPDLFLTQLTLSGGFYLTEALPASFRGYAVAGFKNPNPKPACKDQANFFLPQAKGGSGLAGVSGGALLSL